MTPDSHVLQIALAAVALLLAAPGKVKAGQDRIILNHSQPVKR